MANQDHEGEYMGLFNLIRQYASSAVLRHAGSKYHLAEQIADEVRLLCSAGLVPVLDRIVAGEAVAYIRERRMLEREGESRGVDDRRMLPFDARERIERVLRTYEGHTVLEVAHRI